MVMTLLKSEEREKQFTVVQNSADDDGKEDKESSVSGDLEDWEKTRAQLEGGTVKVRISGVEVLLARSRVVKGTTGKIRTGSERGREVQVKLSSMSRLKLPKKRSWSLCL